MAYYYYAETNLVYLFSRFRRNSLRKMRKKNREVEDFEKAKGELERADMAFGDDRNEKVVIWVLRICTVIAVFIGSLTTSGVTWTLGDIGVGTMAWINLVAILLLSPKALQALRDYERAKKDGEEPRFDPTKLNIKGGEFWEEL